MTKILLTGSEGFVGRNLLDYFLSKNYTLIAPSYHELDLTNSEDVENYLASNKFDYIVHSATTLRQGTDYPDDVLKRNLSMFFNLHRSKHTETKIVNLGSGSEYSRAFWHSKMEESFFDSHVPDDPHSYSKYLISKFIDNNRNHDAVTLRIFGIFGPYEDYRYKFISNAIAKNRVGLPITINQNVLYDYLDVRDFCKIVDKFLHSNWKYPAYNITPKRSVDLISICEKINDISDKKSQITVLNEGYGQEYTGDNSRLLEVIGDFSFTSIHDSLNNLFLHDSLSIEKINVEELIEDKYLDYAKSLKKNYFSN